jgi:hypothetical protein
MQQPHPLLEPPPTLELHYGIMSSSQREQRQAAILDGSASNVIIMDLVATLESKLVPERR